MRQAAAQRLIGAEQQRLERRNGAVQNLGNRGVIHAFILVHHDRGELLVGQAFDGVADFLGVMLGQQLLVGAQGLVRHLDAAGIVQGPRPTADERFRAAYPGASSARR